MLDLLHFLASYEVWIYILLGAVLLIFLRRLLLAGLEWRVSTFGLEREGAQRRFTMALNVVILMALLMVAEFGAVTFVSPNVHVYQPLPTPTIDKLALPTVTLAPIVTAAPTQEEVLAPTLANIVSGGCEKDKIEWTFPVDGEKITGTVELKGTVNVQNIGFFKYEYAPVGTDQWTTIAAGNGTRIDQPLGGKWNTQSVNPGDYQLRIVVADNANNALPACVISVQITAQ